MPSWVRQGLRYSAAVVVSPFIGELVGLPFAFALDILWGGEVTGGRWSLTIPNIVLAIIKAFVTGYSAGWIAQRRGKLMAGLSNFFFPFCVILISIIMNRDVVAVTADQLDTEPAVWVWIGFIPALLGGHFAVKYRDLGIGVTMLSVAMGMAILGQLGATAFHFYTSIVAYQLEGTGAAVVTFMTPVLSELWWFWRIWSVTSTLLNVYALKFLLLIGWFMSAGLLGLVGHRLTERRHKPIPELMPGFSERELSGAFDASIDRTPPSPH